MSARSRIIRPRFEYDIFGDQTLEERQRAQTNDSEEKRKRIVRPNFHDEPVKVENGENVELFEGGESKPNILRTEKGDFILVEASKLSLDDEFMQYEPSSRREAKFKDLLCNVIRKGTKDFYRTICDPSFNKDRTSVIFEAGKIPAVGKSYNWWAKVALDFMPERGSRLGTKSEYIAFLGVLIKKLIANGWSAKNAWNAVCSDSKELGHYWNSVDAKHDFEHTGSREICGFCDLVNTYKILAEDEEAGGFWFAGGSCFGFSYFNPLAGLFPDDYFYNVINNSVGWFVLSA